MKLYGIIESFLDYRGADATNWGVVKTLEEAKSRLLEIIDQQFYYMKEQFEEDAVKDDDTVDRELQETIWNEWVEEHLEEGSYEKGFSYKWEYDDGDCITKFYIDELELK